MSARLPRLCQTARQSGRHQSVWSSSLSKRSLPGRKDVVMIPSNIVHRKEPSRGHSVASLPEDNHNAGPHEEAWLLVKEPPGSSGGAGQATKKRSTFRVMGMDVTPELVAISMVYFVQGILGLSRLAMSFFLKDDLHIQPAEVALLSSLAGLPWMVKPLYGFISDSIPLWGSRRRSYLVVCGLLGSLSWVAFATVVRSPSAAAVFMLLSSLSTAASDVVVDSLVVERARGEPQSTAGSLQSLCWASSAVGGVLSAYSSGSLVQQQGVYFVFGLTAIFPLIVSASALLIDEQPRSSSAAAAAVPAAAADGSSSSLVGLQQHKEGGGLGDEGPVIDILPGGSCREGDDYTSSSSAAAAAAAGSSRRQDLTHYQRSRDPDALEDPEPPWLRDSSDLPAAAAAGPSAAAAGGGHRASSPWVTLKAQVVSQGSVLWSALQQKHILLPTVFVFLWQATPSADTAMFYFYTNELKFDAEFLGWVRLAGSVAALVGVGLYNTKFKKVPLRQMLWWSMVLGTVLGSTQLLLVSGANKALGLSDKLFVLGDSVVLTVLGQVSFMPILVLAARLCPEGVEATLFATLMSILNGGAFVGSALGASLTALLGVTSADFDNLFLLVALCTASTMLPAPFLRLLPPDVDQGPPLPSGGTEVDVGGTGHPGGSGSGSKARAAAVAVGGRE